MPFTNLWSQKYLVPYSGYKVWGTGINPVHEIYGSPPDRLTPIPGMQGQSTSPHQSVPEVLVAPGDMWGYTLEDSRATGVDYDGRPAWNEQPSQYRGDSDDHPPYNAPGMVRERFRAMMAGAHRYRQKMADALPSETVSEGWLNKPKGSPADAKPSSPAQYEMQTSMTQRYRTRVNDEAVDRATDNPRAGIDSRVRGQKLKVYSGGLRHYDMTPRTQTVVPRPFSYRTAGTGEPRQMIPNEVYTITPIERTPPPDPFIGEPENEIQSGFGYTPEDNVGMFY
jgi:hypothetical protein